MPTYLYIVSANRRTLSQSSVSSEVASFPGSSGGESSTPPTQEPGNEASSERTTVKEVD